MKNWTTRERILVVISTLGVLVAVIQALPSRSNSDVKRVDLADHLAKWLVTEASSGEPSPLLLLVPKPTPTDPFPQALADRVTTRMTKAGFTPIQKEIVPFSPDIETTGEPISRENFEDLIRAHPDCRAVLSLVGLPKITAKNPLVLPEPRRIFIVTTVMQSGLDEIPPGTIEFAISARTDAADRTAGNPELGPLGEIFRIKRWK